MSLGVFRLIAVSLLAPLALAAAPPSLDQQTLEIWRAASGVPGIAVVRFDREGIQSSLHSGERAIGSGIAIEADDLWHLGSNAKAMTATLVEVLAQKGLIDRDLTVTEALGQSLETIDPGWSEVGFDLLLTHCSGLPANLGPLRTLAMVGTDATRDASSDRLEYASALLSAPPRQPPGSHFLYSNAGYVIVGAMLEAQTGKRYFELLNEHVLKPLGIASAGIGAPGSSAKDSIDQPRGHRSGWLGGLKAIAPGALGDNPPALTPAGRVHMRLEDYARFLIDLARGLQGQGALLPKAAYQRLIKPGCNDSYARGWGLDQAGRLTHAGSNTMWLVRTWLDPVTGRGLIIASNNGRIDQQRELFERIQGALFAE